MKHIFIIDECDKDFILDGTKARFMREDIAILCRKYNLDYLVIHNENDGHISNVVSNMIWKNDENCIIYSVGSNKTLNHVVNGIADTDVLLGIIPTESNSFIRNLPIDRKNILERTIRGAINDPQTYTSNVGKINKQYFINDVIFAYYASVIAKNKMRRNVSQYTSLDNRDRQKIKDKITYLDSIKALIEYNSTNLSISIDGVTLNDKISILTIMNGRFLENNSTLFDYNTATLNNNSLDVFLGKDVTKIETLNLLRKISNGLHYNISISEKDKVQLLKTNHININSKEKVRCFIDDVAVTGNEFNISIAEKPIKILLPKKR